MTKILLFLGQGCAEVILSTFSFPHRQNAPVDRSYKDDIRQISSVGNNHNTFWVIFAGMALNCPLACVAGVKRERGNLGARERARVKGKEPLLPPPSRAVLRPRFPSRSLSNACHADYCYPLEQTTGQFHRLNIVLNNRKWTSIFKTQLMRRHISSIFFLKMANINRMT